MRTSEQTDIIAAALLAFQAKVGPIIKDKTAEGAGKSTFSYATLDALLEEVQPHLTAAGISFAQGGGWHDKAGPTMETRIMCGGQWLETFYPVKASRDGAQAYGAGLTFDARWGVKYILGLRIKDDFEEGEGYRDAKRDARPAKRAPAPAGIAAALEQIRSAQTNQSFARAVHAARATYPTGESAVAVAKATEEYLVAAVNGTKEGEGDRLTVLRDIATELRGGGTALREAIAAAVARVNGGAR